MGYNIRVYCRCFEEGRTTEPPIPRSNIKRDGEGGYLHNMGKYSLQDDLIFDKWVFNACKHQDGELYEEHLGNVATMGAFRHCLKNCSSYPFAYSTLKHMFIDNSVGNYQYEGLTKARNELAKFRRSSQFSEYCKYTAGALKAALDVAILNKLSIHVT